MSNQHDDLPESLRDELPSLDKIIKYEPRGGDLDRQGDLAKKALELPALSGTGTTDERAELRRKKIAAIQANRGRVLNELGKGGIEMCLSLTGLAIVGVLVAPEAAIVGGIVLLGVAVFGGHK